VNSITEDAANRRRRRLVSHITWLQRHMPSAAALNHRVRELELLVGSDSNAVRMGSQTVATLTNKKRAARELLFPYHNIC
jgi:hypothetical protein